MPSDAANVPPETPNRVRHSFDKIISKLNTVWNLNIPSIHGSQETALQQAGAEHSLAKRCAGRIRYLCWRDCQLDKVISDFEEDATRMCSQWVWKPSQEKGTLPKMPVTKSFISTRPPLVTKHRQKLLECLFVILDEEYKLCRESDVYRRTSYNSTSDTAGYAKITADQSGMSVSASRTVDPEAANDEASGKLYDGIKKGKTNRENARELVKRKSCGSELTVKSLKKQMTLSEMRAFAPAREPAKDAIGILPINKPPSSHQNVPISFGSSTISKVPTEIFTPASGSLLATSVSATSSCAGEAEIRSPDLFPSQDVMDIEKDETFNESFQNLCEPTEADLLLSELRAKTPFQNTELPHKLSLRHRYELQRVADALHITPREVLSDLRRQGVSSTNEYERFWAAARAIAKGRGYQLPERSSTSAWTSALDSFFEGKTRERSIYLSGTLTYKTKVDDGLFDLRLKPLLLDKSCRFHRKYGPSRFLLLKLLSQSANVPSRFKEKERSGVLCESLARWLATAHQFLGRQWRAFFLEGWKKNKATGQISGYKIHLFAVSGDDIPSERVTEIHQLLNWHMPFRDNLKSTNLKLFQRLSLGLSKTRPTITLETSEFIRLPDPVDHAVMNDGCARMSKTLAKDISQCIGLTDVPSVFQGRIGRAKGLWMVVPDDNFHSVGKRGYCIEISDSQLKLLPHPKDDWTAEEEQRTFEMLDHSKPGRPATLSRQVITILYDRGVPRDVLGKLVVADMASGYNELELSMRSDRVRSWVQHHDMCSGSEEGTRMTGSWPVDVAKQSILLIESGFTSDTTFVLWKCLCDMLSKCLDQSVKELHFGIPCSTFLFCIADPYGVLEPNEVHLGFSEVWNDPASGFRECFVDGRDVLVARLPALLPSDVQRRQAVWKKELHHFKDVIVFPTKGEIPLAHMLSGGDYDGDKTWICWDPDVVNRFENADLPQLPSKKDCGLVQQSRQMTDVLSQGTSGKYFASQVDSFLTGCFLFNLNQTYIGYCTVEHEKVVYFDGSLSSANAITLAALCGYLVDSAKQGDMLTDAAWQRLRNQVSPRRRDDPAYKNEEFERHKRQSNIMDYLKFWQAIPEKDRILKEFNRNSPPQSLKDSMLSQPWISMQEIRKSDKSSPQLRKNLDQLERDIRQVAEAWNSEQRGEGRWAAGDFVQVVEKICSQFRAIEPSEAMPESSHPWVTESGKKFGHWSLLRASCLYNRSPAWKKMVWHLAGEELCQIKAQASPAGYRAVVNNIHSLLKCDTKMAKRRQQGLDDDDSDDDETFGWNDIDAAELLQQGD